MNFLGGARGRGRLSAPPPLRRPGQPANSPQYILSMLALSESSEDVDVMHHVISQTVAACSSPSESREAVDIIYRMSRSDRNFARIAAEVLAGLVQADRNSSKKAVLDKLQSVFEACQKMCFADGSEMINFINFLGIFLNKVILRNGDPVCVVANHIVTCLSLVLNRSVSRIKFFTEQILLNGHKIIRYAPDSLAQLMVQARKLLMSRPALDRFATMYIALCIDLEGNKFCYLPDHLISFYVSALPTGDSSMKKKIASFRPSMAYICYTGSSSKDTEENSFDSLMKRNLSSVNKYAGF